MSNLAGNIARTTAATVGQVGVAATEKNILIPPSYDTREISPRDLNLAEEGETSPGCTTLDSDGIARCRSYQPLVLFVGGAYDARANFTGRPVLGRIFPRYDALNEPFQDIGYGTWTTETQLTAIARHWRMQGQKVVLVGHSYGGRIAHRVAKNLSDSGHEVELLVTLDPVGREGVQPRPAKLKRWLNIYVNYTEASLVEFSTMFRALGLPANLVGYIGKPWQSAPGADKNIIFPDVGSSAHVQADEMFSSFWSDVEAIK